MRSYSFTHDNEEMARKQYHYLRDRGVEGSFNRVRNILKQKDDEWELSYADVDSDFYELVADFYDHLASEVENAADVEGKHLIVGDLSINLEEEAYLVGSMWRQQAEFFRKKGEENERT